MPDKEIETFLNAPWAWALSDSRCNSRGGIRLSECCVNICLHKAMYGEENKTGKESSHTNAMCAGHTQAREGRNAYLAKSVKRGHGRQGKEMAGSQNLPSRIL